MKHYKIILFFLAIMFCNKLIAQKLKLSNLVSFSENDTTTKVYVNLEKPKKYRPNKKLIYYYFYKNAIHQSQGGYTGSLLHGKIEVTDQNNQLIKRGNYENGIKTGEWIKWFSNGMIAEISHWKKGVLHGEISSYTEEGALKMTSKYAKGKLHGKMILYNNGEVLSSIKYKKGKVVTKKEKKIRKEKKKEKEKD